jgi:protein tyrosine phosphatase (PTP) superfamily phosphohydrolase (DUF442 family)
MDYSKITDYLIVAASPKAKDAKVIAELGVRLIISMVAHRRPAAEFNKPPLTALWLRTVDFFLLPIPVNALDRGVQTALPVIESGHKVMVFCQAGRHRSVAMAAAILIGMGYTADDAMALIARRRAQADPYAGHIERQIRKFESHWRQQHPDASS